MPHIFRTPLAPQKFATRFYSPLLSLAIGGLFTTSLLTAQQPVDTQSPPAPIERSQPAPPPTLSRYTSYTTALAIGQVLAPANRVASAQPAAGIYLRVAPNSAVRAVAVDPQRVELKVERGLVNLSVHDPAKGQLVLVDLPGGQVQPLKNGFYTFNAATDTARVLKGEADAFPGTDKNIKPLKVKEDHAVTFPAPGASASVPALAKIRSVEFYPFEARTDIIAAPGDYARSTDGPRYGDGYPAYDYPAYGFYGYGYPYYAWEYPYYGYGYPFGFGLGFGYGFYGGGFHGRR